MINLWSLLAMSLAVGAVALFLLLIKWIFKDKLSPKWQYGIWGILLLRAAIPVELFGRETFFSTRWLIGNLRTMIEMHLTSAYSSPWVDTLPIAGIPLLPTASPQSATDWLFILYLVWVLASALYFLQSYLRLRRRIRDAVPVQRIQIQQVAEQYSLPLPHTTVESRLVTTPFVMGVFRPTLVLPMGVTVEDSVILHELLHLKYLDILGGWATTAIRCLHPFLWGLCDRIDNEREAACDQRVLEHLEGEQRRDYGHILLSMVDDHALHTPGATTMANGGQNIKIRIASIANFRKFPRGMELASMCISFSLAITLLCGTVWAVDEEFSSGIFPSETTALSYGQRNPTTTPAGALHAYTTALYYDYKNLTTRLAYFAMCTPVADHPALLEQYQLERGGSERDRMRTAYRTGPLIRMLEEDSKGNYLTEIWMFRDIDYGLDEGFPLPVDFENLEVHYQKQVVQLTQEGEGWYATPIAIEEGEMPADGFDFNSSYPTTVSWIGEYNGLEFRYCDALTLTIQDPWVNGQTLPYLSYLGWQNGGFSLPTFGDTTKKYRSPDPDANFSSYSNNAFLFVTNTTDEEMPCGVALTKANGNTRTLITSDTSLAPYEVRIRSADGGGLSHFNGIEWEEMTLTHGGTATVIIDGVTHTIPLEREVNLP